MEYVNYEIYHYKKCFLTIPQIQNYLNFSISFKLAYNMYIARVSPNASDIYHRVNLNEIELYIKKKTIYRE